MFTIFKKRGRKFSAELEELKAKTADLVLRAGEESGPIITRTVTHTLVAPVSSIFS
jgi:hypothetical protein